MPRHARSPANRSKKLSVRQYLLSAILPKNVAVERIQKNSLIHDYRKWFDIDSDWRLIALSTSMPTLPWPLFNISHWPSVQTGQRGNGSLGVCRLPLLGAEEAPQEHAPRFDPTWLRKCAFYSRFNSGFVHFWNISGTCRQNFCHAFLDNLLGMVLATWGSSTSERRKTGGMFLCWASQTHRLALCATWRCWSEKKTGSTFSSSFYVWCWSLDVLVLSGKKWKKNTQKTKETSRSFVVNVQSRGKKASNIQLVSSSLQSQFSLQP